ncbi:hypothetical protein [Streptococcus sp. S784/96/1]|uniref:hypothetical protein n=1 Tax=Streptococcus sp. S784/96/1 TaxID=2653499 RepID=UPI001389C2EB|nr:hypothetical protein [Streptococcus sp. S784/96/1]
MEQKKLEFYLDSLSEEYKELLYKTILDRSKSIENISENDLLSIDDRAKKVLRQANKTEKYKIFQMVAMMYVLLGVIILAYIYIREFKYYQYSSINTLAVLMIVFGLYLVFIVMLLQLLQQLKKNRQQSIKERNQVEIILEYYKRLEKAVKKYFPEENKRRNLSASLREIRAKDIINDDDYNVLNTFFDLRNNLVHFSEKNSLTNYIDSEDVLKKTKKIIIKIEQRS